MINFNQKFCNIPISFWIIGIAILIIFLLSKNKPQENMTVLTDTKINVHLCKASWCGHCTAFLPVWNKFKNHVETDPKLNQLFIIHTNDCTDETPDICKNEPGFPGVFMILSNGTRKNYKGDRTFKSLLDFININ